MAGSLPEHPETPRDSVPASRASPVSVTVCPILRRPLSRRHPEPAPTSHSHGAPPKPPYPTTVYFEVVEIVTVLEVWAVSVKDPFATVHAVAVAALTTVQGRVTGA